MTIPWPTLTTEEWEALLRQQAKKRRRDLGGPGSGNWGHAGRPGELGGSAPAEGGAAGAGAPRVFAGDEGYEWHEQGPVADWAHELPKDDVDAISGYASFGYGDINRQLRGTFEPNIVNETVREATPEEIAAFKHPPFGHGSRASDYDDDDPLNKVADGRIVHSFFYKGGYKAEGPNERVDSYTIERAGPDETYRKELIAKAHTINASIRERGYVLPEAVTVNRAAYIPGLSYEELKAKEGAVIEEKGFTSTMLGNPSNRLNGYVVMGKSESLYKRFGTVAGHTDEVGAAMRIKITLPEGTKVASVESVRRQEFQYARDAEGMRDFTKPIGRTMMMDKGSRAEAEILLGSGAQFKITSVEPGKTLQTGMTDLRSVPVVDVKMTYIGGGSSEGGGG
jgi:ADP-ribosyltransferase exoenzyme